jgi:hypothetical protein
LCPTDLSALTAVRLAASINPLAFAPARDQRLGSRSVRREKRRSARFRRLRNDQPARDRIYQFGREYPNQTFAGFIAAGSKIATDEWIATLERRIIGIIGTIELHQGKPEIEVMSEDQIKGLDSPAQ